jgi:hypothetical protein
LTKGKTAIEFVGLAGSTTDGSLRRSIRYDIVRRIVRGTARFRALAFVLQKSSRAGDRYLPAGCAATIDPVETLKAE